MSDRCFDLEEFGDLLDLGPGDPRGAHLAGCPLCRSRLAAFRAFLEKQPAGGSRPEEAEAALERLISETVEQRSFTRSSGPRRGPRVWALSLRRFAAPALAAAAIVALFLIWAPPWHGPGAPSGRLRREPQPASATATLTTSTVVRPDGAIALYWSTFRDADDYRVQLFDTSLQETARFSVESDTTFVLRPEQVAALPRPLLWRVQALHGGKEIARSHPEAIEPR